MADTAQENKTGMMIPDIEWVKVPAGEFPYGSGDEQEMIHLDEFYLSRYPITNRQYECFVLAGGYNQDQWWTALGDEPRPTFRRSHWPQPTRPKTDVNWYEAMAFCAWLTSMDQTRPLKRISLPHEQQWEKAACGGQKDDVFAWGSVDASGDIQDYANVKGQLGQTSVIGMYPKGDASIAVYYQSKAEKEDLSSMSDLSGNVWEWCLNGYEENKKEVSDDNPSVLRGGSWVLQTSRAREIVSELTLSTITAMWVFVFVVRSHLVTDL